MFKTEKTYDVSELVRMNMHTHSVFSLCSKPEMIFEDMVRAAEQFGLHTLAITDHSDPGSDIDVIANMNILKERLAKIDTSVNVLIGAELSAYGIGKYAESFERDRMLDYASYSHVHYHLDSWEHPQDKSPRGYAVHMLSVLDDLLKSGRADSIAHPFSPGKFKFFNEEQRIEMLRSITDNELGDILSLGEENGVAWEIHTPTFLKYTEFSKRFWHIGKEAGVHFTVGTDAHNIASLNTPAYEDDIKKVIENG